MKTLSRHTRHCAAAKTMQGVSLIELMISLTIGLMIIAGIGYAYLGSRQGFRSQDALARMQEGARTAFELIAKDIRMAGFSGCPKPENAADEVNLFPDAGGPPWYAKLITQPLIGYEKTAGAWNAFPAGVAGVVGSVINGDALTVLRADTDQAYIVSSHSSADFQFTLTANHKIKQGQLMVAAADDCTRIAVFQKTNACTGEEDCSDNDDKLVQHGDGTTDTVDIGAFIVNARLYPLHAVTYYIGENVADEPALYREVLTSSGGDPATEAEELVEGVQDMQILYGEDSDGDIDKVDVYHTADNVVDWSRVLGIRISLLMVSRSDEQGITTEPQTYKLDKNGDGDVADAGETVTPDDHLLRKAFTTTIAVKNRL